MILKGAGIVGQSTNGIDVSHSGAVTTISIDRPQAKNALDMAAMKALMTRFEVLIQMNMLESLYFTVGMGCSVPAPI